MNELVAHRNHQSAPVMELSDTINSNYANVEIIKRFPSQGMPKNGVPFAIEIQVQTFLAAVDLRTPFVCPDAFVVARGLNQYEGQILGYTFVRTAQPNCRGTARLQFAPQFKPGPDDYVQFELYPGGTAEWFQSKTTIDMVRNGEIDPAGVSQPIRFNASEKDLKNAGIIVKPKENNFIAQTASFVDNLIAPIFSKATAFVGVGLMAYLVWKNGDTIKEKIEEYAK